MNDKEALEVGYWRSIYVNHDRTLRDKIGTCLRHFAGKIDGRINVAIHLQSIPPLPLTTRYRIVRKGLDVMDDLFLESTRNEALEAALHELCPEMFEGKG